MGRFGALDFADLQAVGPGTPSGRYLRRFWQPVMRSRDLPVGRAKPIEILGERFTLYRGESGAPHLTGFRCAHRGTQLSLGWVEGESLRCRYHGWRFAADGQCVEQPNEDRPFCDRVRIASHPTRDYAGLVFAWLGDGAPPPFPTYPDLDCPGVTIADPVEILPCSFWNRFDNDHGHRPWVHRATALRKNRQEILLIRHEQVEEAGYGWRGIRSVTGEKEDAKSSLGLVKGEKQRADQALDLARYIHWFMPNVRLWFQRSRAKGYEDRVIWDTKVVWIVPLNDGAHAAFDVTHTRLEGAEADSYRSRRAQQEEEAETRWDLAEKILAGEMTLEDLPAEIGMATSFSIEDYVTQVGQGQVAGRGPELLTPSEGRLLLLRNLWLREVNALVEGRPLADWRRPAAPFLPAR
jgi:5,5'-dehydrodivanillate O-demethylase oxygenase subunit